MQQLVPTGKLRVGVAYAPAPTPIFVAKDAAGDVHGVPRDLGSALAKTLGVDLTALKGGGRDGLITLDDVLRRANLAADGNGAAARAMAAASPADGNVEPLRGVRRAMAQSMSQSRDQVAGSTVCDDADVHGWTQRGDYMLRLMRAMICAWRAEPALNAWYDPAAQSRFLAAHIDLDRLLSHAR